MKTSGENENAFSCFPQCGNHRGQHIWNAMDKPHPGEIILVFRCSYPNVFGCRCSKRQLSLGILMCSEDWRLIITELNIPCIACENIHIYNYLYLWSIYLYIFLSHHFFYADTLRWLDGQFRWIQFQMTEMMSLLLLLCCPSSSFCFFSSSFLLFFFMLPPVSPKIYDVTFFPHSTTELCYI